MNIWGAPDDRQYIYRPDGGQWSQPEAGPGPSPGLMAPGIPQLAMDSDGAVYWVAAYYPEPAGNQPRQIGLRAWSPQTQAWTGVQRIANIDDAVETLDVSGNGHGDLVVGWTDVDDDQSGDPGSRVITLRSAFVPNGSQTPRPVKTWASQGNCTYQPDVLGTGLDRAGNATVAWTQCDHGYVIKTARRDADGGAWGNPRTLTDSQPGGLEGQLSVNAQGTTMLSVRYFGNHRIAVFRRPPNGSFGDGKYVTPDGAVVSSRWQASLAANGDATLLYRLGGPRIYARSFE